MTWVPEAAAGAVIPVTRFATAKQRLTSVSPVERERLALLTFQRTLAVVSASDAFAGAVIVCADESVGGTLMNESITRAAGATHGQEMTVAELNAMASLAGTRAPHHPLRSPRPVRGRP
jgi:2-phospho-L-lactate guanylyltransferase (CobY/MobA/RfbA family)